MKAGRPRNAARDFAAINGDKFYEGSACWCGNTKRYTRGGRCVDCAIAAARATSASMRKPKVKPATPAQQKLATAARTMQIKQGPHELRVVNEAPVTPLTPLEQQVAEIAARETGAATEEAARAAKIEAINRIETGGLTLCNVKVTESEMAEYIRTGIVPSRISTPKAKDE